ncbi:hypothetical protein LLG46_10465 [bacterium]|nr:hypothetical protein [bacterium]
MFAQDSVGEPDVVRPQPVCVSDQPEKISVEGRQWGLLGPKIWADGDVLFQRGSTRIWASSAEYDYNARTGTMRDVMFTTCCAKRPDYHIRASEVTLLPNQKIRARNASLYLGKLKVLTLPSIKLRTGGASASTNVFPTPGFNKNDGFTLSQILRIIDNDQFHTTADICLTTNNGVQGQLTGQYGINGNLDRFPGRFLTYDSLRSDVLDLPKQPVGEPCPPEMLEPPGIARLRGFGTFTIKQRTYDIENDNLVVYRQPEFGLDYIGRQINFTKTKLDPRLDIYPEVIATWGHYKETPGPAGFIDRNQLVATAGLNIIPLGPSTTLQPVISHTWSNYSNNDHYQQSAFAIDASHLFPNSSFASIRYIARSESGTTPFQFDDVDIFHEYQGAFQVNFSKHTIGLVLSYDIDEDDFYNWEALYGWRSDCLASWLRWNNRMERLSFHVTLYNL